MFLLRFLLTTVGRHSRPDYYLDPTVETSLHHQLKSHYSTSPDQIEVTIGAYRIDVVRGEELIEIQCASLSAIRRKTLDLLQRHDVRIVKPSIHRTRICRRNCRGGDTVSRRLSPRRGHPHEIFEELIYLRDVFPHPRLTLEIPIVDVDQHRWVRKVKGRRRRDPGYVIEDTELTQVHAAIELREAADLWRLLPPAVASQGIPLDELAQAEFNTQDLACSIGCPRWIAQRIAYVMRHAGAIESTSRDKSGVRYRAA
ncbi:hypothetical protein Poly21_23810 [Allorhodopirellula heiligendammensis]|uniref:DUF8091 domain-containing protein n=1 Tax=Allorhodopirellula heiligendammensis TaxID=2714739 RepID=A0A5C6BT05_9BACT|nr:hypothetical protein Poly21_23810 [Allorhodopirellula heiligendammensis]